MNSNNMKTKLFYLMKYDLKGYWRSHKVIFLFKKKQLLCYGEVSWFSFLVDLPTLLQLWLTLLSWTTFFMQIFLYGIIWRSTIICNRIQAQSCNKSNGLIDLELLKIWLIEVDKKYTLKICCRLELNCNHISIRKTGFNRIISD